MSEVKEDSKTKVGEGSGEGETAGGKRPAVEMSFLDHLEELRWRIIKAAIGIVIGTILCLVFGDWLVENILLRPAKVSGMNLQNLRPFGLLILYMQVAVAGGIVLSLPNIFYQLWKFIEPGLYPHERKYISAIVAFTSLCFFVGIVFAYYVMLPMALKFAAGFGPASIQNNFAIDYYFNVLISVMLGAGLVFELPMVSFFLAKLGILTAKFMRHYRRHAIVLIFVAAAILTPGTDPISQVILAIPLIGLYEISIIVAKFAQKKRQS
jgi:sec-independent protein translocase protein TatC